MIVPIIVKPGLGRTAEEFFITNENGRGGGKNSEQFLKILGNSMPVFIGVSYSHNETANQILFSPNEKYIASASIDGIIKIQTLKNKKIDEFKSSENFPTGISISPDSRFLYIAYESIFQKIDLTSKKQIEVKIKNFVANRRWNSVKFSNDSKIVAIGNRRSIGIMNINGKGRVQLKGHQCEITAVAISPNNKYLLSADISGNIIIWDLPNLWKKAEISKAHPESIFDIVFSPDGRYFVTAPFGDCLQPPEFNVKLWDLSGNHLVSLQNHQFHIWDLCFSPLGNWLASMSEDGYLALWRINPNWTSKENIIQTQKWECDSGEIYIAGWNLKNGRPHGAITINQRFVACANENFKIQMWDFSTNGYL